MSGSVGIVWDKVASATLDYSFDYSQQLPPGASLTGSTWTADPGVSVVGSTFSTASATVLLAGGIGGATYLVTNTATTSAGDVLSQSFRLLVSDPSTLGAGVSSVFPSLAATVASLRRDRLLTVASTLFPQATITDDYLLGKLLAAQADLERRLRVFLTPRTMVPTGTDMATVAALAAGGAVIEEEPGYDYEMDLFTGAAWGFLQLRQRPIIAIIRMYFAYPATAGSIFDIPLDWIRPDKKYGRINIVPTSGTAALPLNSFLFSVLGGGRNVPLMVKVLYTAGLANAALTHPDLLDLLKYMTVLSVVDDNFLPASGSTSADGLSQSLSWDAEKMRGQVETRVETLRQALNGPRLGFC